MRKCFELVNFQRWKFAYAFLLTWLVSTFIYWIFLSNSFVYSNPTFDPAFAEFKLEILKGLCESYNGVGEVKYNQKEFWCNIRLRKEFPLSAPVCKDTCQSDNLISLNIEIDETTSTGIKVKIYNFIRFAESTFKGMGTTGGTGDLFELPFNEFRQGMDRLTLNLIKPDSVYYMLLPEPKKEKKSSLTHFILGKNLIESTRLNFAQTSTWFQFKPPNKLPEFLGQLGNYVKGLPITEPSFLKMAYFSGVTILTIGYGDIVPLSWTARVLSLIEGMLGVFFVGMFVANEYEFRKSRNKCTVET